MAENPYASWALIIIFVSLSHARYHEMERENEHGAPYGFGNPDGLWRPA